MNLLPPEYWLREHDAHREEIMREIAARRGAGERAMRRPRRRARRPQPVAAVVSAEPAPC